MALVLSGSIDISGSMTATTIVVSAPGVAGMVSSSAQITELVPLMAYTASLKGAAIVSSSQQIQNYNLFAVTSSANTFYGSQRITGSLDVRGTAGDGIKLRHSNGTNIGEINELSGVQGAGLALKNSSGTQNILLNAGGDSYINGGNLGIGVTSSAWFASSKAMQIGISVAPYLALFQQTTSTCDGYLGWGTYLTGDRTFAYTTTGDTVSLYRLNAGAHTWFTAPSGTANNPITFTEAMVLTSDGYLGIGKNSTAVSNGDLIGLLAFKSNDSSTNSAGAIASIRSYATADYNTGNVEGDMRFYVSNGSAPNGSLLSGNEHMRLTKDGYLRLAGAGIQFNGDTADVNSLDDYEEGTWTPVIGGSTSESGQAYSGQTGRYTKVGRLVIVSFRVVLSTRGTITGDIAIKGLPFTANSAIGYGAGSTLWSTLATSWSSVFLTINANTTFATVEGAKTGGVESIKMATADLGNTSQFNGSITYWV